MYSRASLVYVRMSEGMQMRNNPATKVLLRNVTEAAKSFTRGDPPVWISRRDNLWIATDRYMSIYFCDYWRGRGLYARGVRSRIDDLWTSYGMGTDQQFVSGDIVLDIGANVGEFALRANELGATVYAFEPDPIVFSALQMNLPCEAFNLAIYHKEGALKFYSAVNGADSSLIEPKHFDTVVEVRSQTLDSFVEERGIQCIALLKCDAEGAEPEVLKGARNALQLTQRVTIDCGRERRGESTEDECRELLVESGFTVQSPKRGRQIIVGERKDRT